MISVFSAEDKPQSPAGPHSGKVRDHSYSWPGPLTASGVWGEGRCVIIMIIIIVITTIRRIAIVIEGGLLIIYTVSSLGYN